MTSQCGSAYPNTSVVLVCRPTLHCHPLFLKPPEAQASEDTEDAGVKLVAGSADHDTTEKQHVSTWEQEQDPTVSSTQTSSPENPASGDPQNPEYVPETQTPEAQSLPAPHQQSEATGATLSCSGQPDSQEDVSSQQQDQHTVKTDWEEFYEGIEKSGINKPKPKTQMQLPRREHPSLSGETISAKTRRRMQKQSSRRKMLASGQVETPTEVTGSETQVQDPTPEQSSSSERMREGTTHQTPEPADALAGTTSSSGTQDIRDEASNPQREAQTESTQAQKSQDNENNNKNSNKKNNRPHVSGLQTRGSSWPTDVPPRRAIPYNARGDQSKNSAKPRPTVPPQAPGSRIGGASSPAGSSSTNSTDSPLWEAVKNAQAQARQDWNNAYLVASPAASSCQALTAPGPAFRPFVSPRGFQNRLNWAWQTPQNAQAKATRGWNNAHAYLVNPPEASGFQTYNTSWPPVLLSSYQGTGRLTGQAGQPCFPTSNTYGTNHRVPLQASGHQPQNAPGHFASYRGTINLNTQLNQAQASQNNVNPCMVGPPQASGYQTRNGSYPDVQPASVSSNAAGDQRVSSRTEAHLGNSNSRPGTPSQTSGFQTGAAPQASGVHTANSRPGTPSQASGFDTGAPPQASGVHTGAAPQASGIHTRAPPQACDFDTQTSGIHNGAPSQASGFDTGAPPQASGIDTGVLPDMSSYHTVIPPRPGGPFTPLIDSLTRLVQLGGELTQMNADITHQFLQINTGLSVTLRLSDDFTSINESLNRLIQLNSRLQTATYEALRDASNLQEAWWRTCAQSPVGDEPSIRPPRLSPDDPSAPQ